MFRQVLLPPGSAALAGDVLCRMMLDHCPRQDLNKAHFSIVELKCRWESGWVPGESGSAGVLLRSNYPAQGLSESIVLFHQIECWLMTEYIHLELLLAAMQQCTVFWHYDKYPPHPPGWLWSSLRLLAASLPALKSLFKNSCFCFALLMKGECEHNNSEQHLFVPARLIGRIYISAIEGEPWPQIPKKRLHDC